MEYEQFYTSFRAEMKKLMASDPISLSNVESASKIFAEFHKYHFLARDERSAMKFVHGSYQYFLLIVRHAEHWGTITSHECQLNVKIALDTFLFVVNKTKSYYYITRCLGTFFFDVLFKQYGEFGFIQGFLKVYLYCLNNVPKYFLSNLACKHKNLHLLANILRETHETNMQAIIVAILLKLPYNTEISQLENMFPEVRTLVEIEVDYDYQKIRLVLEKLNKDSTKIFSINCKSIALDNHLVVEFEGATLKNGVWLDVDLSFKTMSFFCSPTILSQYTSRVQFGSTTNWEFVSFKVEDCVETSFFRSYDETETEILEMYFRIQISKINLFQNLLHDNEDLHLSFTISNYSGKYDTFIKDILPQLFPNFVPRDFAYTLSTELGGELYENSRMNFPLNPEVEYPHLPQEKVSKIEERMLFGIIAFPEEGEGEKQRHAQTMRPCPKVAEIKTVPSSPSTEGTEINTEPSSLSTEEIEIKTEPSSPSTEETPAAKGICKKEVRSQTESIFENRNAELKSRVQEHKKHEDTLKLNDKSLKTSGKKVAAVSALSAQSSSRQCRVPVITPSNERKRVVSAVQNSAKRLKENKGTSNIVKEANNNLQLNPSAGEFNNFENISRCHCCMLANNKNCALLDLVSKHVETRDNK